MSEYTTFSLREVLSSNQHIPCVGTFEPVSHDMYNRLIKDWPFPCSKETDNLTSLEKYEDLKMPSLATNGSAGADFYIPYSIFLRPNESVVINTFVRVKLIPGWMLAIYPKSGLGFKFSVKLANTVGIVDSDYYYSETTGNDNEGHIMVKIINGPDKELSLEKGAKFCQGILQPYGIASNELGREYKKRNGGIGSTGH